MYSRNNQAFDVLFYRITDLIKLYEYQCIMLRNKGKHNTVYVKERRERVCERDNFSDIFKKPNE